MLASVVNSRLHPRQAPPSSFLYGFVPSPSLLTTHYPLSFFSSTSKLPNLQLLCFELHTTVPGVYPLARLSARKLRKTVNTQSPDVELLSPETPSTAPASAGPSPPGSRCQHR